MAKGKNCEMQRLEEERNCWRKTREEYLNHNISRSSRTVSGTGRYSLWNWDVPRIVLGLWTWIKGRVRGGIIAVPACSGFFSSI